MTSRAQQTKSAERRAVASRVYESQKVLCESYGLKLMRHSEVHYQIIGPHTYRFRLNIYPGNCRLCSDAKAPRRCQPNVRRPWTLADVVRSVIQKFGSVGMEQAATIEVAEQCPDTPASNSRGFVAGFRRSRSMMPRFPKVRGRVLWVLGRIVGALYLRVLFGILVAIAIVAVVTVAREIGAL